MSFPRNSPFDQGQLPEMPIVKVTPKETLSKITSVHTSDIEDLEHDLRNLEYSAGSPDDAYLFRTLADRVASLYKG